MNILIVSHPYLKKTHEKSWKYPQSAVVDLKDE